MTDSKNVLKGLTSCILRDGEDKCRCEICPYNDTAKSECANNLKRDALMYISAIMEETRPAKPLIVTDYPDQFGNRRTMYICGACERSIVDGARFCIECGRQVRL